MIYQYFILNNLKCYFNSVFNFPTISLLSNFINLTFLIQNLLKKKLQKKRILTKKIYIKFLIKVLVFIKKKKKYFTLLDSNWRYYFLKFKKVHFKILPYTLHVLDEKIELFKNNLSNLNKFIKYFKNRLFVLLKRKIINRKFFPLKKKINKLFFFKNNLQLLFNNIKFYSFFKPKSKGKIYDKIDVNLNINIKIKKNNIFLIFEDLTFHQTIFFISAGRIFTGKKKRNYLTGRFLSKTFMRLVIRFLFKFKQSQTSTNYFVNFFFTLTFNKSLKYFLIKSIVNSFKYYKFPILLVKNIYTTPHSLGLKLKKARRL